MQNCEKAVKIVKKKEGDTKFYLRIYIIFFNNDLMGLYFGLSSWY